MSSRSTVVLEQVLRVMQPLARLLIRSGVTYPVVAAALKRVFMDAARAELAERGTQATDSAVTLLSGVHRRDVRTLTRAREEASSDTAPSARLSLGGEVVARWMSDRAYLDKAGAPRALKRGAEDARGTFDALAIGVSTDVRPRAVLETLLRQGVVRCDDDGSIHLLESGLVPRGDFTEMARLFSANLHDHAAAAATNLLGTSNFLEQAVYVDQINVDSAEQLQRVSVAAWKRAFKSVMAEAQDRFDADAAGDGPRDHRVRFGVYFYGEREDKS